MLGYEWRKLLHRPVILAIVFLLLFVKPTLFIAQLDYDSYSDMNRILDEMYGGYTVREIFGRIDEDIAQAESAINENMAAGYDAGEITITELRAWNEGTEERYVLLSALEQIRSRVFELMELQFLFEDAKEQISLPTAGQSLDSDSLHWIARWKPLSIVHENGWALMLSMESFSFTGYLILFLVIPLFLETRDTKMLDLLSASKNGWKRTHKAKACLSMIILGTVYVVDVWIDYGLPGVVLGYGNMSAAIQSISSFSGMIFPWSLSEYIGVCCLTRLCGMLFLFAFAHALCAFVHSTYGLLATSVSVYVLLDVFSHFAWSIDRLLTPGELFTSIGNPVHIMHIMVGYMIAAIVLETYAYYAYSNDPHGAFRYVQYRRK